MTYKNLDGFLSMLWEMLLWCGMILFPVTLSAKEAVRTELFQQVLILEFPESEILQWEESEKGVRVDFLYKGEEIYVFSHDPLEKDLDGDNIQISFSWTAACTPIMIS